MTRRFFALLLPLVLAAASASRVPLDPPTVVLLVRHAEKAAQPADDPPLSPEGQRRADALVAIARDAGVGAIVTTQFLRTKGTAEPTAKALSITPEVIAAQGAAHAQSVADAIRQRFTGRTVLVVGHSNTVPAIAESLGAPRPAALCDSDYDHLYVVILSQGSQARVIKSRYGPPGPSPDPNCGAMR